MTQQNILTCEKLSFWMQGKNLISDLSFVIKKNEIVAVLGQNGCGKSTLLSACAGLIQPNSGRILIDGVDAVKLSKEIKSEKIRYLTQNLPKADGFTVSQFMTFTDSKSVMRFSNATRGHSLDESTGAALQNFDVVHLQKRNLNQLSGGEWHRVQLARLWMQKNALFILDEPDAGLDPRQIEVLSGAIQIKAKNSGSAVIFSTHNLDLAKKCAHKILCFNQNGLLWFDSPLNPELNRILSCYFCGL